MRPQLGVESGRLLFRAAVSDTLRPDGAVRDAVERFLPPESPAEVWRAARASAVEFLGGTADAEAAILPIVVEDGSPVADFEARRIGAGDALLANWAAVAAPAAPAAVLLVHVGETRTTARFVRYRPGVPLADLGSGAAGLAPVEFGLQNAVDAVLDALCACHHDRAKPGLDASMLRAILEYGLALQAVGPDGEVRWRGPYASRLWQPLALSLGEYLSAASGGRFASMVEDAARLTANAPVRVVFSGAGAFFPDAPAAFAARFDRSLFSVDPSAVARGAARWRETSTVATEPSRPPSALAAPSLAPVAVPPWAR